MARFSNLERQYIALLNAHTMDTAMLPALMRQSIFYIRAGGIVRRTTGLSKKRVAYQIVLLPTLLTRTALGNAFTLLAVQTKTTCYTPEKYRQ